MSDDDLSAILDAKDAHIYALAAEAEQLREEQRKTFEAAKRAAALGAAPDYDEETIKAALWDVVDFALAAGSSGMSTARDCPEHGEWVDDGTTDICPECLADKLVEADDALRRGDVTSLAEFLEAADR